LDFVIVTGLSGSGKSSVIDVLEDVGYYCIDNIPPELIPKFADICAQSEGKIEHVAIVTDIRGGSLFLKLKETVLKLQEQGLNIKLLFLDTEDDVLVKRYKETRRKHPLDESVHGSLYRAIKVEREMLFSLKGMADFYIDTSNMSVAQLKERVKKIFLENASDFMQITIVSFGFKFGSHLPNPFYVPELREHTGVESCISDYVMQFDQSKELLKRLEDLVSYLIPLYIKEGKSQLVIAFGCTGGNHRSVTFAEKLGEYLVENGFKTRVYHRDINKL